MHRRTVLVLLACLWLGACGDVSPPRPDSYVVQPGDTLYSIAWRHDVDYRDLARWNGLASDLRLRPGQILYLRANSLVPPPTPPVPVPREKRASAEVGRPIPLPPVEAPRAAATPASVTPASSAPPASQVTAPAPRPRAETAPSGSFDARWVWPTRRAFPLERGNSHGLIIRGHAGQEVLAAAQGRVVYTGSGLRGYGKLVIIKHDETLLSAYGYNDEVIVKEGEPVRAGQLIGKMGSMPGRSAALYFEIRRNGKAIDPLIYLVPR